MSLTATAAPTDPKAAAGEISDIACEIDGLLLDLRCAVHAALGMVGPEIDMKLPREVVRTLGHINTAIGSLRVLAGELCGAKEP